jgi:hypothetical protein
MVEICEHVSELSSCIEQGIFVRLGFCEHVNELSASIRTGIFFFDRVGFYEEGIF